MTNFGFELEVRDGANAMRAEAQRMGLTVHDYFHGYHCRCNECSYSRPGAIFAAQEDGTVQGEFITKILTFGSEEHYRAIDGISVAALKSGAKVNGNTGNHVHVSTAGLNRPDTDTPSRTRFARLGNLFLYHAAELEMLAAAGQSRHRTYNGEMPTNPPLIANAEHWRYGSLLSMYPGGETVEFRLWNATTVAWRLHLHVAVSVAMVEAAADSRVHVSADDDVTLLERL